MSDDWWMGWGGFRVFYGSIKKIRWNFRWLKNIVFVIEISAIFDNFYPVYFDHFSVWFICVKNFKNNLIIYHWKIYFSSSKIIIITFIVYIRSLEEKFRQLCFTLFFNYIHSSSTHSIPFFKIIHVYLSTILSSIYFTTWPINY